MSIAQSYKNFFLIFDEKKAFVIEKLKYKLLVLTYDRLFHTKIFEFKLELLKEIIDRLVTIYRDVLQKFLELDQIKLKERYFSYYANELENHLKKFLHVQD